MPCKRSLRFAPRRRACPVTDGSQPLRMPVQLMRSEPERAQRAAAYGMAAHPRNSDRPSCRHPYSHPASIRAQRARRLFHFHWKARGLRNPRPVLAPDRGVIQHFPRHRRNHETRRRSRAPYQQIPSCDLHASPFNSFMATEAAHLDVVPAVAVFAVAHLHAVVGRAPQPRDGMSPDIAAVPADAIHLVNPYLIGFAIVEWHSVQARPARFTWIACENQTLAGCRE